MNRRKSKEEIPLENDPLWYRDALIYELHVRSFFDSDGDGIGDFRGLVTKLDYLQDLGVSALWLLPFYPSPLRDDGYDISDYTGLHPSYGSVSDFKKLLREAHRRGLRVITELILNHTSDQHPWFQRARRAQPGTTERDFYVWSDTPDKYKEARIIFKDFEPSNWAWDAVAQAYYWHRFYSHQPDLNFDNPAVRSAVFQVVDFWLELGIDGLRLDAVPYLYEHEGTSCENLPETHAFLKELRQHIDANFPNRMLLAEANQWPEDAAAYFGNGDECHMAFHFPIMPRLFMCIRMEDRFPLIDIAQQTPSLPENSQWALFLRNHDELTLEMVTDEDRDYMYRVYAQDPQARINLGIRRRLAPLLENHRGKIELMNGLLFSLPGTPVLYYGDEIGMGDNIYLGDRNGVRTPMQWTSERNAGFSKANPQRLFSPVIIDPEYHFTAVNVETQQNNPHSLLWWMKHLIALRKRYRAFGRGSLEFLHSENRKVLAFVRRYQEERILIVANLSRFVQFADLDCSLFKGMTPVEMLGRTVFPTIGESTYNLTLGPYAFYWFTLELQPATIPQVAPEVPWATLKVTGDWEHIFRGKGRASLEEVLPSYLRTRHWFGGKKRSIKSARIVENVPIQSNSVAFQVCLIQVEYTDTDPETYVLPLAFAGAQHAASIQDGFRPSVVCRLQLKGKAEGEDEGFLYDPFGERGFSETLLHAVARRRHFKGQAGEVEASHTKILRRVYGPDPPDPEPTLLKAEKNNSSLFYGDRWFLKMFRRVEEGPHPEREAAEFLSKQSFPNSPPVAGALEYHRPRRSPTTLAILEGFIVNQGDAWTYTLDALGRYFEQALTAKAPIQDLTLPRKSLCELAETEIPEIVPQAVGPYLESARLLGQRTAEMHRALASDFNNPDFAPEPFTPVYQRNVYQSMRSQARRCFDLLRGRLRGLNDPVKVDAQKVLGREDQLLKWIRQIFEKKIHAVRIRTHGDYHLGQVLSTGKDFVIIDFEGDPSRPIEARRRKQTPLRDVASLLRSFHYASFLALQGGTIRPEDVATLLPWAYFWQFWVSVAFLKSYLAIVEPAELVPKARDDRQVLLDFYLLKRAVFELRSELSADAVNPDRVRVPIEGIVRYFEGKE